MLKVNRETIIEAEKKSGLSTRDFAERLGISLRTYSQKFERGTTMTFNLKDILIAQELSGIPIEYFFTDDRQQNANDEK